MPNGKDMYAQDGLTARQWYAGMALAGLMANPQEADAINRTAIAANTKPETVVAGAAFDIADAMIAHEAEERKADQP